MRLKRFWSSANFCEDHPALRDESRACARAGSRGTIQAGSSRSSAIGRPPRPMSVSMLRKLPPVSWAPLNTTWSAGGSLAAAAACSVGSGFSARKMSASWSMVDGGRLGRRRSNLVRRMMERAALVVRRRSESGRARAAFARLFAVAAACSSTETVCSTGAVAFVASSVGPPRTRIKSPAHAIFRALRLRWRHLFMSMEVRRGFGSARRYQ